MDTTTNRAKLQEVLETVPNDKWTAIGKCLVENDLLDQQIFHKQWDSESRGDVFLDVLHDLADGPSRVTVSWKQVMNILQMQLGHGHEIISLAKEIAEQNSSRKQCHGYGSTTVQWEGSQSRAITDSLMDPSTPLLLQGHKGSFPKWRKVLGCLSRPLIVVLIFLIAFLITGLIVFVVQSQPTSMTKLGYSGDTVLVDTVSTFWSTKLTASECLQVGDEYHVSSLYLVPSDALVTYEYDRVIRSRVFQQPNPSRRTGMINTDMYLLEGSRIDYDICVTSEDTHRKEGELYVFDNKDNFNAYLEQLSDDGKQLSLYYQPLQIGAKNVTLCTHLHYLVNRPSYYFVSAWGPGDIIYSYNTTIHTVAFNHSQYDEICRMTETFQCDCEIPSSLFEIKLFTLLAYVHPLSATDPLTTHICLSTQRSVTIIFVVSAFASLIVILLVLVVALFICMCTCIKRQKHGYRYIQ